MCNGMELCCAPMLILMLGWRVEGKSESGVGVQGNISEHVSEACVGRCLAR